MTQKLDSFTYRSIFCRIPSLVKRMRLAVLIVFMSLTVSAVWPVRISAAAAYYVATNGSDGSPGTDSRPFRSIAKGLSVLRAGDTLFIKGGTYGESINSNAMRIPTGTSWSAAVTISAYPGHTVVIRPGSGGEVVNLAHSYIQYLLINGLIIDATNVSYGISLTNGAHHVRVQNSEIKNARRSGILTSNGSGATSFNQFVNLKVHHNGSGRLDHGLYISTSNNIVERCEVYSNSGYGVHVFNSSPGQRASNNIVRSNKVRDNGSRGIIVTAGDSNAAYNNLVWGNKTGGIEVNWQSSSNAKIYNNTIYANTGYGIEIGADSSNAKVVNNIVYQNSQPIKNSGRGTQISNNLTNSPLFVNGGSGDFSLQSASPAIDVGVTLTDVRDDFNGASRPQGKGYDIGAHEFKGASPTVSAPAAPSNLRVEPQ